MPQGHALEAADSFEVIAAYSAPQTVVPAYNGTFEASSAWYVVGSFFLPRSVDARLDAIVFVTASALRARIRLYDLQALQEVEGSLVATSALIPTRTLSGVTHIEGGRMYQIQADCILESDLTPPDSDFAVVAGATISD